MNPLTMLPTPSTSHVNYKYIYEPAEDSYLLLDTLSSPSETAFLAQSFPPTTPSPLVLEIGTGSGVVLAFATAHARKIFGREDIATLGTDVNVFACSATGRTVQGALAEEAAIGGSGGAFIDSLVGDLASPLRAETVDVLIFNPPYVPTEGVPPFPAQHAEVPPDEPKPGSSAEFERDTRLLSLSYAGGMEGMETTERLLEQIPTILSARGVAYILLCAQNKPEEVIARIRAWPGEEAWTAEKVASSGKTAGWERLCVLRIWRPARISD